MQLRNKTIISLEMHLLRWYKSCNKKVEILIAAVHNSVLEKTGTVKTNFNNVLQKRPVFSPACLYCMTAVVLLSSSGPTEDIHWKKKRYPEFFESFTVLVADSLHPQSVFSKAQQEKLLYMPIPAKGLIAIKTDTVISLYQQPNGSDSKIWMQELYRGKATAVQFINDSGSGLIRFSHAGKITEVLILDANGNALYKTAGDDLPQTLSIARFVKGVYTVILTLDYINRAQFFFCK